MAESVLGGGVRLVVDCETTPIPDDKRELPGHVWCAVARDVDTDVEYVFIGDGIRGAIDLLMNADLLIGHNIAKFDVPVLEKLFGQVRGPWGEGRLYDTLCASQLIFASNLYERSIAFRNSAGRNEVARERQMPSKLLKSHSLEAWGYRLRQPKLHTDVDADFYRQFSDELLERCRADVVLNAKLFRHLTEKPAEHGWDAMPMEPVIVDSEVAYIIGLQERNGVAFDVSSAEALEQKLTGRRAELVTELRQAFPAWIAPASGQKDESPEILRREGDAGYTVPKATRNMRPATKTNPRDWPVSYVEGCAYTKVALVEFNPASTQHRAAVLRRKYGWRPEQFTDTGEPVTDEAVLAALDYPEIPALLDFMTVNKRLGQLSEGKEAWLKRVRNGRIHGKVNVTGTRTSRMSHTSPNLGQVPKKKSPYGAECRALFGPTREGWVMVGADASGLELRMLAHRMAYFDDGAFGKLLLEGDPHEAWRQATGLILRENQKTFTYAFLYGAGDEKLGQILLDDWREAYGKGLIAEKPPRKEFAVELGKQAKAKLLRNVPALGLLLEKVREAHARGFLRGLDGRILAVKTEHGALNDLLQSDGAIVMKHALLRFAEKTAEIPFAAAYLLNVHDEWQLECEPLGAQEFGEAMVAAIRETGPALGVRCPLDGEYHVGRNWLETH
jgi:hypothetical protein